MSENRKHVKALLKRLSGQDSTLTIQREYILLCGKDHLSALLLSQIIYWSDRSDDPDGWVAKSYSEWEDELCMSQYQVNRAADKLKSLGVEVMRRRSKYHKGGSTLHYRVDMDTLTNQIIKFLDNQEVQSSHHQETSQSHHQETSQTYTETTAKTTAEKEEPEAVEDRPTPQEAASAIFPPSKETDNIIPLHMRQFERQNNAASHPWVSAYREIRNMPAFEADREEMRLIAQYAGKYPLDTFKEYAAKRLQQRTDLKLLWILRDMPEDLAKSTPAPLKPYRTMSEPDEPIPTGVMSEEDRQAGLKLLAEYKERKRREAEAEALKEQAS